MDWLTLSISGPDKNDAEGLWEPRKTCSMIFQGAVGAVFGVHGSMSERSWCSGHPAPGRPITGDVDSRAAGERRPRYPPSSRS